eukprot:6474508-Amphidinium_carterae.2
MACDIFAFLEQDIGKSYSCMANCEQSHAQTRRHFSHLSLTQLAAGGVDRLIAYGDHRFDGNCGESDVQGDFRLPLSMHARQSLNEVEENKSDDTIEPLMDEGDTKFEIVSLVKGEVSHLDELVHMTSEGDSESEFVDLAKVK